MAGPLDEANALISSPITDASAGLPRRPTGTVVTRENTTEENTLAEAQAAGLRAAGYAPAVEGLARQITGDQAGAKEAYRRSGEYEARSDAIGAQSDAPTDYRDIDGVGSALAYARRLAIGSAPDMLGSLGLGAAGRGLARRTAMNIEREAVAARVADNIASGVETPLTRAVAARQAAETTIPATQAVADAQAREALQAVAGEAVSRGAGGARVDAAGRVGALAGATVGQFPGMVAESREHLEKTDQEGALKIAGADALAAAVGSLPAERLLGRIAANPAAREAIDQGALSLGRQLAGRAGRAAKDTLAQAALEGTTEAAQAVVQRAGHAWVDKNIRMLSPDAVDDYIANFVGGAVLGGLTGGAVETANATVGGARDTLSWLRDRSGPMRETIRDRIQAQMEKASERVANTGRASMAGESMGVEGGKPDTRSAADRFNDLMASGRDFAQRAADAGVGALQKFDSAVRGFVNRDEVELRTDQVLDDLQQSIDTPRDPNTAAVLDKAKSFTQKWMLSKVDPLFLARVDESDALRLGRIMEKYASGQELTRRESTTLGRVVENPASGITQRTLDMFTGIGPTVSELSARMSDTAGAEQAAPQMKAQVQRTEDVDATEQADAVAERELGDSSAPRGPLRATAGEQQEARLSRLAELRSIVDAGATRPMDMPGSASTAEKRAAWREQRTRLSEARKELPKLQEEVVSSVLGNKSPTQKRADGEPVRANVFDENRSAAGQKRWAEAEASPNYVRLADTWSIDGSDRPAAQRRTMLNIPFAVEAQLARHGHELGSTAQERGEGAFKMMLAEAQAAGINIDLSSLTPGDVTLQKRGQPEATRLFTLTPTLIRQLTTDTDTAPQVAARRERQRETLSLPAKMAARDRLPEAAQRRINRDFAREKSTANSVNARAYKAALRSPQARALTARISELRQQPLTRESRKKIDQLEQQRRAIQGEASVAASREALKERFAETESTVVDSIYQRMLDEAVAKDPTVVHDLDAMVKIEGQAFNELERRRRAARAEPIAPAGQDREAGGNELEQADGRVRAPREQPQGSEARPTRDSSGAGEFVSENTPLVTGARSRNPAADKMVASMRRNFAGTLTLEQQQEAANRRYRKSPEGRAMLQAMNENTEAFAKVSSAEADLATALAAGGKITQEAAAEAVAGAASRRAYAAAIDRYSGKATPAAEALDRLLAAKDGLAAATRVDAIVRGDNADSIATALREATASDVQAKQYVSLMRTLRTEHRAMMAAAQFEASQAYDAALAEAKAKPATSADPQADITAARRALAAAREQYGAASDKYKAAQQAYEQGGKDTVPVYNWNSIARAIARQDVRDQVDAGLLSPEGATAELARIKEMSEAEAYGYVELATAGGAITHARAASDERVGEADPATRLLWQSVEADAKVLAPDDSTEAALANAFGIAFSGARAKATAAEREAAMRLINSVSALADGAAVKADGDYVNPLFNTYDLLSSAQMRGQMVAPQLVATNKGTARFDMDDAAAIDAGAPTPGQLKAEADFANRVLAQMGIKSKVSVGNLDGKGARSGAHTAQADTGRILIGDGLRGGERMEVLSHELGHHVILDHVREMADKRGYGRMTLGALNKKIHDSGGSTLNMLEAVDPELAQALKADYDKWRATLNNKTTFADMRASRSPILRAQAVAASQNADVPLGRIVPETFKYHTSFDEWLADNIAKALLHRREVTDSMGLASRFFQEVAAKLRALYDSLVGNGYRPAESVEAWVASMFDSASRGVRMATKAPTQPSVAQTRAVVEAAVVASHAPEAIEGAPKADRPAGADGKPPRDFQGMMRYVREYLSPQDRQILETAFSREAAHQRLRSVYAKRPDVQRAMTDAATGMEARIAAGYLAWQAGKMNAGPKSQSVMIGIGDALREVIGVASDASYAHRIMNEIASGKIARLKDAGRPYDSVAAERRIRGIRQAIVDQASDVAQKVWHPFSRLLDSNLARMNSSGIPAYRAIGAALYKPTGTSGSDIGYVRSVSHVSARFSDQAARAMEGLSAGQQRRVIRLLQEQATPERMNATIDNPNHINHGKPVYSAPVRRAFREVRTMMNDAYQYLDQAGVKVGYRKNFFPLMLDLHNPRAVDKLTELLSRPEYEQAIRELYADRPRTSPKPVNPKRSKPSVPPIDPAAAEYFANQRDRMKKRIDRTGNQSEAEQLARLVEVNESIVHAMETGNVATIEKHIKAAEARRAKYADGTDAARIIDLETRFARSRIEQLKNSAETTAAQPADGVGSNSPIADLVADLVNGARRDNVPFGNVDLSEGAPNFRSANFRLMEFVYRLRDEAAAAGDTAAVEMHERNIAQFAALQVKDPQEAFARYIEPAVRRAEYARRFGDDGSRLEAMLEQMKAQGATEEQVKHARASVEAAVGAYGRDMSPGLAAISPALAQRVSGERTRAVIAGLQTYQNSRSLPLALLSSLVDPMGIAVRSGGDFATAWTGFKTGIKSLTNKATREEIHDMLQMLGSTSDMGSTEVLSHAFGGEGSPVTAKVNEFIFKLNGMAAWTRATRYMALTSAHQFLMKHGNASGDTASRYRDELGLKKGDVSIATVTGADGTRRRQVKLLSQEELAKATPEQQAADARVKQALMQFVDEAILRPNSQQVPLWHSDPYMRLFSQYKAFSYAIYEQILGRMNVELQNGNGKVALAAMAYLPIVIAAELLRNVFQGDEEDTADFGPGDYLALGVERSGLYPPVAGVVHDTIEDVRSHRTPGSSQIGPTASQARNIVAATQGRRDLGKEFEAALPGSALYKKWNDGRSEPAADEPKPETRS